MKQVMSAKMETVAVNKTSPRKYYAVVFHCGAKGIIAKESSDSPNYTVHALDELTEGNRYDDFEPTPNIQELIKKHVEGDASVYEFEDWEEMFRFLSL